MDEKHISKNGSSLLPFALTNLRSQSIENSQSTETLNNKAGAVLKFVRILLCNLDEDSAKSITYQLMNNNFDALIQSGIVLYDHLGAEQFTSLIQIIQSKGYNINTSPQSQTLAKELYPQITNQYCVAKSANNSHKPDRHSQTSNRDLVLYVGPDGNWVLLNNKYLDFRRRGTMRRILLKLVEHRHSKQALTSFALINAGWPSCNNIPLTSAITRLYTTISRMRSIGLRDYIESYDGGYALASQVVVIQETSDIS